MRYEGVVHRPPSEADACILQAPVGCPWNACVYRDMDRAKRFRVRVRKVFVADGDALAMTNHASRTIDAALEGRIAVTPKWARGF